MNWQVEYPPWAVEDLRGFSLCARTLVYGWIERHLAGCANPRRWGKGDQDGGRWRYRVGEYRLIAEIEADFQRTLESCQEVTMEYYHSIPWYRRMLGKVLNFFAPLL